VTEFLKTTMMHSVPYDARKSRPIHTVRDLVHDAHKRVATEFSDRPEAAAELQVTLSLVICESGDAKIGLASQRQGIDELRGFRPGSATLANSLKLAAIAHSAEETLARCEKSMRHKIVMWYTRQLPKDQPLLRWAEGRVRPSLPPFRRMHKPDRQCASGQPRDAFPRSAGEG
jgi:hypothetical protein